VIQLTPKASKSFKSVDLYVDNSGNIAGGNIYESNGGSYAYAISGITSNAAIADAQFSFNAKSHPGVDVTDLR
jgi:outer membrane lipoprotein-sorting protein